MNLVLFLEYMAFYQLQGDWLLGEGSFFFTKCRLVGYWESFYQLWGGWLLGELFTYCGVVGYWSVLGDYYKLTQQWPNLHLEKKSPQVLCHLQNKYNTEVMNIISIDNDIIYLYYHEYCPNPSFFKVMFGPLK